LDVVNALLEAGGRELLMLTKQNGANVLVNFCTILGPLMAQIDDGDGK